jgi:hypothetical protein
MRLLPAKVHNQQTQLKITPLHRFHPDFSLQSTFKTNRERQDAPAKNLTSLCPAFLALYWIFGPALNYEKTQYLAQGPIAEPCGPAMRNRE